MSRDGRVCVYTSATSHIFVDVVGYLSVSTPHDVSSPSRLIDTRRIPGFVPRAGTKCHTVVGRNKLQADALSSYLTVTLLNQSSANAYLPVFRSGVSRPGTSSVNAPAREPRANNVWSRVGPDGKICVYSSHAAHYLIDASVAINGTEFVPRPHSRCGEIVPGGSGFNEVYSCWTTPVIISIRTQDGFSPWEGVCVPARGTIRLDKSYTQASLQTYFLQGVPGGSRLAGPMPC